MGRGHVTWEGKGGRSGLSLHSLLIFRDRAWNGAIDGGLVDLSCFTCFRGLIGGVCDLFLVLSHHRLPSTFGPSRRSSRPHVRAPTMQARPQIDVYAMLNSLGISREQFQNFNPQERQIAAAKYMQQQQQMASMGINPQSLYQQQSFDSQQQQMMPPPVPRPPTAQGHHPASLPHRSPTIPGGMGSMHDMQSQRPQSRMVCFFFLASYSLFLYILLSPNATLHPTLMGSNNSTLPRTHIPANQGAPVANKPST